MSAVVKHDDTQGGTGHSRRAFVRGGLVGSLAGILVCGGIGGVVAWAAVNAMDIGGVTGAILASGIGMVVATGLWIGGGWLLRVAGILR